MKLKGTPPPWGGGVVCQNHEIKGILSKNHEIKENVDKKHEIKGETVENLLNLTQVY